MRIFLIAILFCWLPSILVSQENCNLTLSGKVIDEHDGSDLSFSTVYLLQEKRGISADEDGSFMLQNLCVGTYTVVVSHIGCDPDTQIVQLDKSKKINFVLEHHLEQLQEVSIVGESSGVGTSEQKKLSQESFDAKSGKPLAEMLNEINGVSSFKTGANISKPVIGAFKNNRVQLINQGVQLQSQQWGDEHAPEIDPFAASQYTVIKGAGAVRYSGGALGGVVIANPKPLLNKVGIGGELNSLYSTNNRMGNASLMLEGKNKWMPKFAWRLQGSGKRSGNVRTPNYYQKNTGVQELNGSADFGYFEEKWNARIFYSQFNSEIGIFSGAHIGNLTDLQNAINRSEPRLGDQEGFSYEMRRPYQRIIHELVKGEVNYYFEDWGKVNFVLARQFNIREEFDKELPRNDELAALNIPEFSLSLESYSSQLNWSLPQQKQWKTDVGVQWMNQSNRVNSFTDFIPDYTQNQLSLYGIEKWEKEKLELELGLRLDQTVMEVNKLIDREFKNFDHDFLNTTLHLGSIYRFNDRSQLRLNLTYAQRPPAINELYSEGLHHGSASLEFGNSELGKETSYGSNATYELKGKRLTYELYAYLQYIEDFIYLNPDGLDLTIRGAFPSYSWQNTDALIQGLDQRINYQLNDHFQLENKLSLLWGNDLTNDNFLINMPANRTESSIRYELEREGKRWVAKFGNNWVFRQNRFNTEQEIADPPDTYQLFFANLGFWKQLKNERAFEMGVRLDNILNTVYRDYLNRFRFFTDEQGRNATIRMKYKF